MPVEFSVLNFISTKIKTLRINRLTYYKNAECNDDIKAEFSHPVHNLCCVKNTIFSSILKLQRVSDKKVLSKCKLIYMTSQVIHAQCKCSLIEKQCATVLVLKKYRLC